jgi:hypothetical protein
VCRQRPATPCSSRSSAFRYDKSRQPVLMGACVPFLSSCRLQRTLIGAISEFIPRRANSVSSGNENCTLKIHVSHACCEDCRYHTQRIADRDNLLGQEFFFAIQRRFYVSSPRMVQLNFFRRSRLKRVRFSVLLSNPIRKTFFADPAAPHSAFTFALLLFTTHVHDACERCARKRILARQTCRNLPVRVRRTSVCWLRLFELRAVTGTVRAAG